MDPPSSYRSPFLADIDRRDLDSAPSSSPFAAPFTDFNSSAALDESLGASAQNQSSVPPTPFSSSSFAAHAGSYHNSPLGSDISYIPGNEFAPQHSPNPNTHTYTQDTSGAADQYNNFDIAVLPPDFVVGEEYDPSAYDAPSDNSLLFGQDFYTSLSEQANHSQQTPNPNQSSSPSLSTSSLGSNHPGVSVSVIPALDNLNHNMSGYASGSPYDHGSPGSSNGGDDFHQQHQQQAARSRGSSISSQHNDYQGSATYGMEGVHLDTSPNPNTGSTPSWAMKNPQSPPQIYIPGQTPDITHTSTSPLPSPTPSNHSLNGGGDNNNGNNGSILPPGGIGMGIHIVPATPISAGVTQGGPFHMSLMNSGRTSASNAQSQPWGTQPTNSQQQSYNSQSRGTSALPRLPQAPPSQYTFPPNAALTPPPSGGIRGNGGDAGDTLGALGLSREGSPERGNANGNGSGYLVPISPNPRTRSKSETSIRPLPWQMGMGVGYNDQGQGQNQNQGQSQNQNQGQGQGSSIQLPNISYMTHQSPQFPRLNAPPHSASFGPPVSGSGGYDDSALDSGNGKPNNNYLSPDYSFGGVGAPDLRRARSESHGGHRRNALSADMTPIYADQSSGSSNNLYPPSLGFPNNRPSGDNFLTANGGGMNLSGGIMSSGGVHRRSMSGGSGHGHSRSLSRDRASLSASPYPSPHASPRTNGNEPLPDTYSFPSVSAGFGLGGYEGSAPTVTVMGTDEHGNPTMQQQPPLQVARQNVTTHATADASSRRRRTEANFACPVPGCGSTFTRHFNLKGHLRSHNEERPFKCKWPGCDKGFARQHDCKRHEQLHLNIRPYTCQGCQRTFARMDALNRHLRSDAGTDCQSRQPILTNDTPNNPEAIAAMRGESSNGMLTLKDESDRGWQSPPAGGVMV